MTTKDVLALALETFEESLTYIESPSWSPSMGADCRKAITAIKQAQEQKVKLIPTAEEIGTPMQPQAITPETGNAATPLASAITAGNGQAPYSNCRFRICDLPGQCKGEGKCHHPAVQQAQEPVTPAQALSLAEEWEGQAGGQLAPQLTTNEIAGMLEQFATDRTKDWPQWMRDNSHVATASFPVRGKPAPKQAEPRLPEFFAQYEYDTPNWDVVVSVYQRHPDKLPSLVHKQTLPAQQAEPVGINGLTEAETSASMSVMGLSKPAPKQAEPVQTSSRKTLALAQEGIDLHDHNAPEYIICAELVRLNKALSGAPTPPEAA
jgi:hypothetical protein